MAYSKRNYKKSSGKRTSAKKKSNAIVIRISK